MEFLTATFLGNTVRAWLIGAAIAMATFLALRFVAAWMATRLTGLAGRTQHHWDDVIATSLASTKPTLLLLISVFMGSNALELPARWAGVLESMAVIALLIQGGIWASAGLTAWLEARSRARAEEDPGGVMTVNIIGIGVRIALWSIILLLALDNLGVDVTALVAGLGVGGIAVALAAQNILGDLFASLSIALDKPFVLGDFVIVGDFLGTVEAIGLKTTRIRSLSGEQVVFSNTDLLASRIRNYGRMYERRVVLKIGVTYQTPREELQAIPDIIRDAIEEHPQDRVRFDRSHLDTYGDFAITFEAVYYVLSPDYAVHMDVKQDVHLRVHEVFEERGIEFAYPTQTLFVEHAGAPDEEDASRDDG